MFCDEALGGEGGALHSFAGVTVVPTWAAGKHILGLSRVCSCSPNPPPKDRSTASSPWAGRLARCCLAKSLGILFHSSDAGRTIPYLLVFLQRTGSKDAFRSTGCTDVHPGLAGIDRPACCTQPGGCCDSAWECASV